jgi:hypothetical protein
VVRLSRLALLAAALVLGPGCSSNTKHVVVPATTGVTVTAPSLVPPTTTVPPTSLVPPTTTVPSATTAPMEVAFADADNGRTVRLQMHDVVVVTLHSTYWTFGSLSSPAVLQPVGSPVYAPQRQGCVPGQGCGTVTARFRVVAHGQSTITASRSSCGEALRCSPDQSSWRLTVTA